MNSSIRFGFTHYNEDLIRFLVWVRTLNKPNRINQKPKNQINSLYVNENLRNTRFKCELFKLKANNITFFVHIKKTRIIIDMTI